MRKCIFVALSLFLCCHFFLGQMHQGEMDSAFMPTESPHHNPEFISDVCINNDAWKNQGGIHCALGSTNKSYFRREVPNSVGENLSSSCFITVWKGERANLQILVWSSDSIEQVRLIKHDLIHNDGIHSISKEHISCELVRYVLSNYPYAEKQAVCGDSPYKNGFLMPDRFEDFDRFDLSPKTTRPIWVMINVPVDAKTGIYESKLELKAKGSDVKYLNVKLRIQNQILPLPKDWSFRLDLWQNPWVVAWSNHIEPWSEEHLVLLKKHLQNYAEAGGKYITTYGVHSPWSDNSYMNEGGMIEWIKQSDGLWRFDYTIFDKYVKVAMDCGINKAITIYTAIPWGNRFRYLDESTGDYVYATWKPGTEVFTQMWNIFLTDLKKHLEARKWLSITYIGINENPLEETLAAIKTIKAHDRCWKITYAGDWHEELDSLLDDYSYLYGKEPTMQQQSVRNENGRTSTVYVCCNPPVPNNFVFSPPIEGRWIGWYIMAHKYNGFLRWAYDAWPEDPERDARHGYWPAGDCFMVYPGGKSCVRFEKMREGIVDFEKLRILRDATRKSNNSKAKEKLKEIDDFLSVFLKEKAFDEVKISKDVNNENELIVQLSDILKN